MIRISHLNAALTLTSKLDAMGYRAVPVVNTPLSSLNGDLCVPFAVDKGSDWSPNMQTYIDCAKEITPGQDCSVYSENMDQTARSIAAYVQSHLSFTKNIVKPIITELVECFTEKVNSINVSPSNDFKIIKQNLPAPMLVAEVKDVIDEYEKIEVSSYDNSAYGAPVKSIQEIVELMKTGSAAVDEAIDQWVAVLGDQFFINVYEGTFVSTNLNGNKTPSIGINYPDSTLAVFLMTRNLHNNPWEGCNMSLVNYNVCIASMRDWTGNLLSVVYKNHANGIKTGKLINTIINNTVTVNADVYEEWISQGNTDLVLFGIVVKGARLIFVNEINNSKVELMKVWDRYAAMSASSERNRKYTIMKSILFDCVFKVVEANAVTIFQHLKDQNQQIDHLNMKEYKEFKKAFEEYYSIITEEDFNDIWKVAKHIVCNQLFYYTDAGDILDGIEDSCKNNPELSVDEAALLSTIKYVTKYVSNQMVLCKI